MFCGIWLIIRRCQESFKVLGRLNIQTAFLFGAVMKAGQLRHRVEILRRVKEKDKSGATVMVWRPLCKVWADVRHLSGS